MKLHECDESGFLDFQVIPDNLRHDIKIIRNNLEIEKNYFFENLLFQVIHDNLYVMSQNIRNNMKIKKKTLISNSF